MRKRIGLLTFQEPENRNYGAILQTYAGLKLLKKFEKNVKIINFKLEKGSWKNRIYRYLISRNFRKFSKKFLDLTIPVSLKNKNLKITNNLFDIFVVGSDQIWRAGTTNIGGKTFYLDFVDEKKKKISYAASFGVEHWEGNKKLTEEVKNLIKKFDYISVREESGVDICKNIFEVDTICVLDPTLMVTKEDYQPILDDWKDKKYLKKKYIAHMLLDDTEELKKESKKIASYLRAEINYIKGKSFKIFGIDVAFDNKVSQWLNYLRGAELVITDSFHCTVFSIIFHKKFIVVANPGRGIARLETLLSKVGLEDRFFTDIKDVMKSGILDKEIDYDEVEKKLAVHRKYSMDFLKKALED